MKIEICKFDNDHRRKEHEACGTILFPVSAYYNDMNCYPDCEVPWHWHEEVETLYVEKGNVIVNFQDSEIVLKERDGMFINANQLHAIRKANIGECVIYSFVFSASLIAGSMDSVFGQHFVMPLLQCII